MTVFCRFVMCPYLPSTYLTYLTYLVLHDLTAAPPLQYCLALVVAGTGGTAKVATATATSQPPSSDRDATQRVP